MYLGSEQIQALGEKLLPEFNARARAILPRCSQIKVHRDSPAYTSGAVQINVMDRAWFSIWMLPGYAADGILLVGGS
ncbi:hypothetical protein [Nostoc sp.]|uniref:hypothetical protein n=1 Tax=Nostoc sp. TaxID=1180 RepID=UPI002FF7C8C8